RQKDRDVIYEQIAKKFEAEVLKIGAKMEEVQVKERATIQGTIGRQLAELVKSTDSLTKSLATNARPSPGAESAGKIPTSGTTG
ncbi:MAG TPA: hypothetical protein VMX35_08845, partial [Acidobacteriota bacterium]|nr:hypothetical protein [Acidobacteriota bacterium]